MESDSIDYVIVHCSIGLRTLSKKDYSHWRGILFAVLVLGALSIIPLVLFPKRTDEIIWSSVGILLFSGYILHDTSEIIHRYGPGDEVAAALNLPLDFINIFSSFIRLFMRTSNDTVTADTSGDVTYLLDTD